MKLHQISSQIFGYNCCRLSRWKVMLLVFDTIITLAFLNCTNNFVSTTYVILFKTLENIFFLIIFFILLSLLHNFDPVKYMQRILNYWKKYLKVEIAWIISSLTIRFASSLERQAISFHFVYFSLMELFINRRIIDDNYHNQWKYYLSNW